MDISLPQGSSSFSCNSEKQTSSQDRRIEKFQTQVSNKRIPGKEKQRSKKVKGKKTREEFSYGTNGKKQGEQLMDRRKASLGQATSEMQKNNILINININPKKKMEEMGQKLSLS